MRVLRVATAPLWSSVIASDLVGLFVQVDDVDVAQPSLADDEVKGGMVKAGLGSSTAFGQWLSVRGEFG